MQVELIIQPEAEADLAKAYDWYEDCREGLGEEFLGSIDDCFAKIRRMPTAFAPVHEGFRRVLVGRFPYVVFYEYTEFVVTVFAVFHANRDPEKWRERRL